MRATAVAASGAGTGNTYSYDIQVSVDTDGFRSDPLSLSIDAPRSMSQVALQRIVNPNGNSPGYENDYVYTILDTTGNRLSRITPHETLENYKSLDSTSNWAALMPSVLNAQIYT